MTEHEHERLADEAEAQADDLERRNDELEKEIEDVQRDLERKAQDSSVPGIGGDPDPAEDDTPTPVDPLGPKPDAPGA